MLNMPALTSAQMTAHQQYHTLTWVSQRRPLGLALLPLLHNKAVNPGRLDSHTQKCPIALSQISRLVKCLLNKLHSSCSNMKKSKETCTLQIFLFSNQLRAQSAVEFIASGNSENKPELLILPLLVQLYSPACKQLWVTMFYLKH